MGSPSTGDGSIGFPDAMYLPSGDQAIAILEGMVSNMDHHPNPLLSRYLYTDSLQHSIVAHLDAGKIQGGRGVEIGGGNIA